MARYTGPVCRLCRRVGKKLFFKGDRCFSPKCAIERQRRPPGQVSQRRRRRLSDRGVQLQEKQKARYIYGVMERQFQRLFAEASRAPGATGFTLLQLLERRLDNVVYRLGFAFSRRQARQLVTHGHFRVNGHKVDIASYLVKIGEVVSWHEGSRDIALYKEFAEKQIGTVPRWLERDQTKMEGKVLALPARDDVEAGLDEKAIVEYYAR